MDRHFSKRKTKCEHCFLDGLHAFGYKTIVIAQSILRLLIDSRTARCGEEKVFRYYCETDRMSKKFHQAYNKPLFTSYNSEDSVLILK